MKISSLIVSLIATCVYAQDATTQSAVEYLNTAGSFTTLLKYASDPSVNVTALLSGASNFTLFAPTDLFTKVTNNKDLLKAVLSYHALLSIFNPAGKSGTTFEKTVTNEILGVTVGPADAVTLSSGLLQKSKVTASQQVKNAIIHTIDKVLIPPMSISDTAVYANLTSLVGALTSANFVDTVNNLKNVTVLAPSNDAFARLMALATAKNLKVDDINILTAVLSLHIVDKIYYSTDIAAAKNVNVTTAYNGAKISVSSSANGVSIMAFGSMANVTAVDVLVKGGVVHVISEVLLIDLTNLPTKKTVPSFGADSTNNSVKPGGTDGTKSGAAKVFGFSALVASALVVAMF